MEVWHKMAGVKDIMDNKSNLSCILFCKDETKRNI